MPAEADQLYANKPYLLTLKGQVTVHFIDGQTLTGEITSQDAFNIFLSIEGVPHLVSRSQIRYIKGEPGQAVEIEAASTSIAEASPPPQPAPPMTPPESDVRSTSISPAQPTPQPAPPETPPQPEPAAEMAFFVEDEEPAPSEEDTGGTLVIPPLESLTVEAGPPPLIPDVLEESEKTIVLTPEPETSPEFAAPTSVKPDVIAPSEPDEDVTFVLTQNEEISAHLVCTTGPHAGEVFQLRPGITTIGRSSDNAVPLSRDKEVSRRHALIAYEASKFVIQDQNSLNGTFVNNQPVKEPQPLEDSDIVLIGVSTLKFQERA